MTVDNSGELKSLTSSINDIWSPTKTQFDGKLATVAEIDNVLLKPWLAAMNKGETSQEAYDEVMSKLPKGVTESKLLKEYKEALGRPLDTPDNYDQDKLDGELKKMKKKVAEYLAFGMFCDDQIKHAQNRINQINMMAQLEPDMNTQLAEGSLSW